MIGVIIASSSCASYGDLCVLFSNSLRFIIFNIFIDVGCSPRMTDRRITSNTCSRMVATLLFRSIYGENRTRVMCHRCAFCFWKHSLCGTCYSGFVRRGCLMPSKIDIQSRSRESGTRTWRYPAIWQSLGIGSFFQCTLCWPCTS
jgi:hypothetical protein